MILPGGPSGGADEIDFFLGGLFEMNLLLSAPSDFAIEELPVSDVSPAALLASFAGGNIGTLVQLHRRVVWLVFSCRSLAGNHVAVSCPCAYCGQRLMVARSGRGIEDFRFGYDRLTGWGLDVSSGIDEHAMLILPEQGRTVKST
jgi:hypothetical protein